MAVSLKHTFVSAIPDGSDTSVVRPSNWNAEHTLTGTISTLMGFDATGASQSVTVGSGLTYSAGSLTATGDGSGTVTSVAALTLGTSGTDLTSTVANGTTTPVITLNVPTASASNRGVLSSTDWTTFNNKGSGTITSVTATAPVVSTGGTTPVISMAAATASVNGYLTSTDWTTFNNKGSGTVTSVAAITLGTTGTDLSSTVDTGTTTPVITLNVPTASASNRGVLSSADWTTFNNKGSGTVTSVTGTAPVVSSGGATPAISMAAATTSVSGYLTSTDWTTFNNKGSGTVTSVSGSGGTTGLTLTGGAITTTGTLTLGGTLAVANGGTGITSFGTGIATFLGTPSSANLAAAVTDETGSGLLVFATSPSLTTPLLGTPTSGNLSNCTADGTNKVGYLEIPQNAQTSSYTLVLADSGKSIYHAAAAAAATYTIPANGSVAYALGTAVTFINMSTNNVTIAITTDTLYLAGTGTTGSRTLAQYGVATATKMTSTTWIISGSGLT
jgi:hypothetical protein